MKSLRPWVAASQMAQCPQGRGSASKERVEVVPWPPQSRVDLLHLVEAQRRRTVVLVVVERCRPGALQDDLGRREDRALVDEEAAGRAVLG